jgi:hypothetical protein
MLPFAGLARQDDRRGDVVGNRPASEWRAAADRLADLVAERGQVALGDREPGATVLIRIPVSAPSHLSAEAREPPSALRIVRADTARPAMSPHSGPGRPHLSG